MATESVHFPNVNLNLKPVYEGKYRDYHPEDKPAGMLTYMEGDGVHTCMKPKDDRPPSPEVIRRFRRTFRPDVSKQTIFYGKSSDPHRRWAEEMRHGVDLHPSEPLKKLVNPPPMSLFKQKLANRKEEDYASHVRAPLGKSHDPTPNLPAGLDTKTFIFGQPLRLDEGAGMLINPPKAYAQVKEEAEEGHENYITTHKDYHPMEHVNRRYTDPPYNVNNRMGGPTYCDHTGALVRKSLRYPTEMDKVKATKIVSKRLGDFREKFQPKTGIHLDPIKETMRVGPDHTFGLPLRPDGFGVRELIHNRLPRTYLQEKDLQRGLIAAMRQTLRELNYHSFPELIHAFRYYDKEGTGKIDKDDMREACISFSLPVDPWLLEQVLDYCDENLDRQVDYNQFARFLDWKERLPDGFAYVPYDVKKYLEEKRPIPIEPSFTHPHIAAPAPVPADAGSAHMQGEIDRAMAMHHTSAEMVSAAAGPTGLNTAGFRAYGIPSIRSDLPPPYQRKLNDRQNYGDEATAYGLTNPSVYSMRGVYGKHLLIPRTKQELQEIFTNIGVEMPHGTFEGVYERVAAQHPRGHVSVESFRNALDALQRAQITAGTHPLAF